MPPIQQPECCLLCLKKPPSGALKSRRTPGTLSPREGCEGCGEGERDSQCGCGMCQKTGHVPVDGHTHKHTTLGFFCGGLFTLACLSRGRQLGRKTEIAAPREKQIKRPFFGNHRGLHALIQQRKTWWAGREIKKKD